MKYTNQIVGVGVGIICLGILRAYHVYERLFPAVSDPEHREFNAHWRRPHFSPYNPINRVYEPTDQGTDQESTQPSGLETLTAEDQDFLAGVQAPIMRPEDSGHSSAHQH